MRFRVFVYALGMLLTGTCNTLATKFQDLIVVGKDATGKPLFFQHPAVQSACMFAGEALCLIPYFIFRWRKLRLRRLAEQMGQQQRRRKREMPRSYHIKRMCAFAICAGCDATATTLLNIGLFYTYASTYQMLRGTLVFFAGLFTIAILRRSLYIQHWLGMVLIMAGAAIVGAASVLYPSPNPHQKIEDLTPPPAPGPDALVDAMPAGGISALPALLQPLQAAVQAALRAVGGDGGDAASSPLFGDLCVVAAQGFAALQFILEEKFLSQYRVQPLLAVGLEGAWGLALCTLALPLLSVVPTHSGQPLDDAAAAFRQIAEHPALRNAVLVSIVSVGMFNFFGLLVTKALSGAARATIDACRTLFVWLFSMAIGWEVFRHLQVVGFLVLVAGTSLYNELLRSCLPALSYNPADDEDGGDEEEGGEAGEYQEPLLQVDEEGYDADGYEAYDGADGSNGLPAGDGDGGDVSSLPTSASASASASRANSGALLTPAQSGGAMMMDRSARGGGAGGSSGSLGRAGAAASGRAVRGAASRGSMGGLRAALSSAASIASGSGSGGGANGDVEAAAQQQLLRQQQAAMARAGVVGSAGTAPIRAARGSAHAHSCPHYTMARSMRLGFNALSPHDLCDDEDDEGADGSVVEDDVADPMFLASTPYSGHLLQTAAGTPADEDRVAGESNDNSMHGADSGADPSQGQRAARPGPEAGDGGGGFLAFLAARRQASQQAAPGGRPL